MRLVSLMLSSLLLSACAQATQIVLVVDSMIQDGKAVSFRRDGNAFNPVIARRRLVGIWP